MKVTKKLVAYIVAFAITCTLFVGTDVLASGTKIEVFDASCNPGEEVSVEISMPVNTGLVSMLLEVSFDDVFTLTEVVDGGILGEYNHSDNLKSPYILSWENDKIKEDLTATGKIVTLKFEVSKGAEPKGYPVKIERYELLDKDINDVPCNITDGKIVIADSEDSGGSGGGGGGASTYTIKFETNGGSKVAPQSLNDKNNVVKSVIPVKEGYIFEGWYIDNKLITPYDFDTKVTKSFTLYAKWTKIEETKPVEPEYKTLYNDVNTDDWFFEYVTELTEKGIVSGDGTGIFAPNDNVTREQFLKMLIEAIEIELSEGENTFADVDDDGWYKPYVLTAKKLGIVNGISNTQFGIGTNISRQDMAVMINRAIEILGIQPERANTDSFADAQKVSSYAAEAVNFMKSIGLIEGYNNEFRPLDNLTRAEAAKVISELIEKI